MNASDLKALVDHRLQKSEEALQAAKIMMDQQMYGFAISPSPIISVTCHSLPVTFV